VLSSTRNCEGNESGVGILPNSTSDFASDVFVVAYEWSVNFQDFEGYSLMLAILDQVGAESKDER